jgi:hypothetical protein
VNPSTIAKQAAAFLYGVVWYGTVWYDAALHMSKMTSWHVKLLSLNFLILALGCEKEEITCGYGYRLCEVISKILFKIIKLHYSTTKSFYHASWMDSI